MQNFSPFWDSALNTVGSLSVYNPTPDQISDNKNHVARNVAIAALVSNFDHKDVRIIMIGGQLQDLRNMPYPNSCYTNRYLIPQLMSEEEMLSVIGINHQGFYELVDKYAKPYLQT